MHPSITQRRKVYLILLTTANVLILSSVYVAYKGLPHSITPALLRHSTPFSEYLRLSTPERGLATPWTPLSLSVCQFGTPTHYAPCLAQNLNNVAYAEELLYPDFEIREPYFAKEEHRERWQKATSDINERGVLQSGWMAYKGQSGQNFVFNNVKYTWSSSNFDTWSPESCMSSLVSTSPIEPITDRTESRLPIVTIALSPDSYSFQHHLDRVTHIIAQGSHLFYGSASEPYVVTGRRGSKTVQQLWEYLGYDEDHVLNTKEGVEAETMVFSCRAVLIHPWLSLKALESFGIQHDVPSATRNKIVYMSRSDGRTLNVGRRVVNEEEVLEGIRTFLAERKQGEELVVFNPDEYESTGQLFEWFSKNVAAVVGPHGGAMINHRWAAKGTLVIEFMPTTRTAMMIFEEAGVLSQNYAAILVEPTEPAGTDMEIDVRDVVSLLGEHLGVVGQDPLRKSYYWRAEELGLDAGR
ncbi:hypothetical protein DFH07DRAFT_825484 [Mycena maculata]|uniref:Glycosyltransferase 61 catalytic domain-containing protein n=1 Tax=Mycena maculata TaxID=230809 RepID=A0AAD7NAF0_9AGAR|nr:hypothetical protein DFH07DRAFT_825484 [Mycena maculata]